MRERKGYWKLTLIKDNGDCQSNVGFNGISLGKQICHQGDNRMQLVALSGYL